MRSQRERARIVNLKSKGEGKGSDNETRGRAAARTPDGDATPRNYMRRDSPAARRSITDDPKKACVKYTKGKCTKSHAERPYVHNPKCYWHMKGKCKKGTDCLFPHRALEVAGKRTEDQIALQLGIDESSREPEPVTERLSNAEQFTQAENIRNKVVQEDGDRPQDWSYPCQNLEDEQDATHELCHDCNRDIRNLHQIQCRRCTFRFCGLCVWFCQDCHWTICMGCACGCEFSDNYDSEQDPLRVVHRFHNTIPEEEENEGESEAKAEAKAEAAAEELK